MQSYEKLFRIEDTIVARRHVSEAPTYEKDGVEQLLASN